MKAVRNPLQNVAVLPESHASPATGGLGELVAPQRKRSRLMTSGANPLAGEKLSLAAADDNILHRRAHKLSACQDELPALPAGLSCFDTDVMDQPAESEAPGIANVATALVGVSASELLPSSQESLQTRALLIWSGGIDADGADTGMSRSGMDPAPSKVTNSLVMGMVEAVEAVIGHVRTHGAVCPFDLPPKVGNGRWPGPESCKQLGHTRCSFVPYNRLPFARFFPTMPSRMKERLLGFLENDLRDQPLAERADAVKAGTRLLGRSKSVNSELNTISKCAARKQVGDEENAGAIEKTCQQDRQVVLDTIYSKLERVTVPAVAATAPVHTRRLPASAHDTAIPAFGTVPATALILPPRTAPPAWEKMLDDEDAPRARTLASMECC